MGNEIKYTKVHAYTINFLLICRTQITTVFPVKFHTTQFQQKPIDFIYFWWLHRIKKSETDRNCQDNVYVKREDWSTKWTIKNCEALRCETIKTTKKLFSLTCKPTIILNRQHTHTHIYIYIYIYIYMLPQRRIIFHNSTMFPIQSISVVNRMPPCTHLTGPYLKNCICSVT